MLAQVQEARLSHALLGDNASLLSSSNLTTNDALNLAGCVLVPHGQRIQVVGMFGVPIIVWQGKRGVTYQSAIE